MHELFKKRRTTIVALNLCIHNFPTNRDRELSKLFKEVESLLGSSYKKTESFGIGDVTTGRDQGIFGWCH